MVVEKDGRDIGACEEVVQVIGRLFLFFDLGLQLCIYGDQLFVEGLELFARGLKLFVGCLEFLVRRLHLFIKALELFDIALQLLSRRGKLGFELAHCGFFDSGGLQARFFRIFRSNAFFPEDKKEQVLSQ